MGRCSFLLILILLGCQTSSELGKNNSRLDSSPVLAPADPIVFPITIKVTKTMLFSFGGEVFGKTLKAPAKERSLYGQIIRVSFYNAWPGKRPSVGDVIAIKVSRAGDSKDRFILDQFGDNKAPAASGSP